MNADPGRAAPAAGRSDHLELTSRILARLTLIDEEPRFPDVCEIREVARAILEEQLRELSEEDASAKR